MLVSELIEKLRTFDDELPVIVKNENGAFKTEFPINDVKWDFDGYCKIVIDED